MSSRNKVRNHYVPQLYLKQWEQSGHVQTYRLLVAHENMPLWKPFKPSGVAFRNNFYTYVSREGVTDEFENWLDQEFENPAAIPLNLAISGKAMKPSHWHALIKFLAALDVRTPKRLRDMIERNATELEPMLDKLVGEIVREIEASPSAYKWIEPSPNAAGISTGMASLFKVSLDKDTGQLTTKTVNGRRYWIEATRHALTQTVRVLLNHRWTIVRPPAGITWPTSDNPVVRLSYRSRSDYELHAGWGVEKANILLPLSPTHLMLTQVGESRPCWNRGAVLDKGTALFFRKLIIENADRFIFSTDTSGIEPLRPRTVCAETAEREKKNWEKWHEEQSEAERTLL